MSTLVMSGMGAQRAYAQNAPTCSLEIPRNGLLVNFAEEFPGGFTLVADETEEQARTPKVTIDVPEGRYRVTLQSYDTHDNDVRDEEAEQWHLRFYNDADGIVRLSSDTQDIPENRNYITTTVDTALNVDASVTYVRAFHAAYQDEEAESVIPVCAVLQPLTTGVPTAPPTVNGYTVSLTGGEAVPGRVYSFRDIPFRFRDLGSRGVNPFSDVTFVPGPTGSNGFFVVTGHSNPGSGGEEGTFLDGGLYVFDADGRFIAKRNVRADTGLACATGHTGGGNEFRVAPIGNGEFIVGFNGIGYFPPILYRASASGVQFVDRPFDTIARPGTNGLCYESAPDLWPDVFQLPSAVYANGFMISQKMNTSQYRENAIYDVSSRGFGQDRDFPLAFEPVAGIGEYFVTLDRSRSPFRNEVYRINDDGLEERVATLSTRAQHGSFARDSVFPRIGLRDGASGMAIYEATSSDFDEVATLRGIEWNGGVALAGDYVAWGEGCSSLSERNRNPEDCNGAPTVEVNGTELSVEPLPHFGQTFCAENGSNRECPASANNGMWVDRTNNTGNVAIASNGNMMVIGELSGALYLYRINGWPYGGQTGVPGTPGETPVVPLPGPGITINSPNDYLGFAFNYLNFVTALFNATGNPRQNTQNGDTSRQTQSATSLGEEESLVNVFDEEAASSRNFSNNTDIQSLFNDATQLINLIRQDQR